MRNSNYLPLDFNERWERWKTVRWLTNLNENIKRGIRSWLNVIPANPHQIQINEILDFEANAIRNRIWYRGDSNELEQLYRQQNMEYADKYKFWASKCTPGMEMRKIHTGLPGLIVRIVSAIVLADMNDFAAFNEIYAGYFTGKPARSCVAVKTLPKGALVEVDTVCLL